MTNKDWDNRIVGHDVKPASWFVANPKNWRIHPLNQQEGLTGNLDTIGWIDEVTVNVTTGNMIDGHLRVILALRKGDETNVPLTLVELSEAEEEQALLTLDPLSAMAFTDKEKFGELYSTVDSDNNQVMQMIEDISNLVGMFEEGNLPAGDPGDPEQDPEEKVAAAKSVLAEKFIVPPFSVLDSRQGYWLTRKRAWINIGMRSELGGRDDMKVSGSYSGTIPGYYYKKEDAEKKAGKTLSNKEFEDNYLQAYISKDSLIATTKTGGMLSIFDPVLAELCYRWFMPTDGTIIDPFAGGSVRGVVASLLGFTYTGVDLRPEQVEENITQAAKLCADHVMPIWVTGDGKNVKDLAPGEYDFIFSCPPYGDLEVYSDKPDDLSNMGFDEFLGAYKEIIKNTVSMLKQDRFACFVVGDFRDKKGFYRNFPALTIQAFQEAGMVLYNECILVNTVGSMAMRVSKQFQASRKLGKTHQNVLVFYKGDPKKIKDFGEVEVGDFEAIEGIAMLDGIDLGEV